MPETCATCRFYFIEGELVQRCRRYPKYEYRTPDQWCGEHRQRAARGKKKERKK